MLTIFADEEHCPNTFYLHNRVIPKLDGAANVGVELSEGITESHYVIRRTNVQYPALPLLLHLIVKVREHFLRSTPTAITGAEALNGGCLVVRLPLLLSE
jgi:hypothetical protein